MCMLVILSRRCVVNCTCQCSVLSSLVYSRVVVMKQVKLFTKMCVLQSVPLQARERSFKAKKPLHVHTGW